VTTNDLKKRLAAIEAEKPNNAEIERLASIHAALADDEYKSALCAAYVKQAYGPIDGWPIEGVDARHAKARAKMDNLVSSLEALTEAIGMELTPETCRKFSPEVKEKAVQGHEAGPGSTAWQEALDAIMEAAQ